MQIDWLTMIHAQQKLAAEVASVVMLNLAKPKLSLREIAKLRDQAELGSEALNTILRALNKKIIDEAYFFASDSLRNFWSELAVAIDKREAIALRNRGVVSTRH